MILFKTPEETGKRPVNLQQCRVFHYSWPLRAHNAEGHHPHEAVRDHTRLNSKKVSRNQNVNNF